MIRAFIAIQIPDDLLKRIETEAKRLKNLRIDARFTKKSSIHLTLKFLGDIDENLVASVGDALQESARALDRFRLGIEGLGVFPIRKTPRVIWIGVRKEPMLVELHQQVEANLQGLGFETEGRPFRPHLTIARLKSSKNLAGLEDFIVMEGAEFKIGTFEVGAVHLYQSLLYPDGAEYRQLSTHTLGTGC